MECRLGEKLQSVPKVDIEMNIGSIAYIPPRKFPGAQAFYTNVHAYKTKYPVYLFSNDQSWEGLCGHCDDPEKIRRGGPSVMSNAVFLNSLFIANELGLDWLFYLEADSRVKGDNWDERIFDEHFSLGPKVIASGSPVVFNPHAFTNASLTNFTEYAYEYLKRVKRPLCVYGNRQPHQIGQMAVYPNGSCAVYNVSTLKACFQRFQNPMQTAQHMAAWDISFGFFLGHTYHEHAFERVAGLKSVLSACTYVYYKEDELKFKLANGEVAAVHQVKSEWVP